MDINKNSFHSETFNIEKPILDTHQYKHIVLKNQLKCLLISDSKIDESSAALSVNVGHWQDPSHLPGLAHLVEHMLFLGNKKYPEESAFSSFLAKNGGRSNAGTGPETTTYYFSVLPDHFSNALDIFSGFFSCPTFNTTMLEKEITAVDNENAKNFQMDSRKLLYVRKALSNPSHPFCNFGTGNRDTLWNIPKSENIDPVKEAINFYYKYYSSNIMNLCLMGKESLDVLTDVRYDINRILKITQKYFSDIPNKNFNLPSLRQNNNIHLPILPQTQQTITFYKPVRETRTLTFCFLMDSLKKEYENSPFSLISHLIGHEGPGSIFYFLKNQNWCDELSCGMDNYSTHGIFEVTFILTKEGLKKIDEITSVFFQYVSMLKKTSVEKWQRIYDDAKLLKEQRFTYRQNSNPIDHTRNLAKNMNDYKIEHTISGDYKMNFKIDRTTKLLNLIDPSNLQIFAGAKEFEKTKNLNLKEKWFGTPYVTETSKGKQQLSTNCEIEIPQPNPFISRNLFVVPNEKTASSPTLIEENEKGKCFHLLNTEFGPKAQLLIKYDTEFLIQTPKIIVTQLLFFELLEDDINDLSYDFHLAGLYFDINIYYSSIEFDFRGYSEKVPLLAETILQKAQSFKLNHKRFNIIKEQIERRTINFETSAQPYSHNIHFRDFFLFSKKISISQKLSILSELTPLDIEEFAKQLFKSSARIDVLGIGNIESDILKNFWNSNFNFVIPSAKSSFRSVYKIDTGKKILIQTQTQNSDEKNCSTTVLFEIGPVNQKDDILLDLFHQFTNRIMTQQLRTQEQLGYIVWSSPKNLNDILYYSITVQSSEYTPSYLSERIQEALKLQLENLEEKDLQPMVESLINKKLIKPVNLAEFTEPFWEEIWDRTYQWNRVKQEVQALKQLTKKELLDFFQKYIFDQTNRKQLTVHRYSKKYELLNKESALTSYDVVLSNTEEIIDFQSKCQFYPSHLDSKL